MDVIFGRLLRTSYTITQDFNELCSYPGIKVAYSFKPITLENVLWLEASPLLFEDGISEQPIEVTKWNEYSLFFPSSQGAFPIDIFAVSFFLVSRYEEYCPNIKTDKHNRFPVTASVSYQLGFHRKPMVNILAHALAEKIQDVFPDYTYQFPKFETITTYDIDIAYKYKGKKLYRWTGSLLKSLIHFDYPTLKNLLRATLHLSHYDSFDRFHLHKVLAQKENNKPIHFVLTAPFAKFDKNIDPNTKTFKKLIHHLSQFSEIGLHPSYKSSENNSLIFKEKSVLEKRSGMKITKSRQHFLRFQFPSTFEALIESGFLEDYSLGWHDEAGFRTSTTIPIPFFNLKTNQIRPLTLIPLTAMDGSLYHCCQSIEECLEVVEQLRLEVQKYGGTFVILYHNNSEKHLF
jgi:hypothetical protein